MKHKIFIIFLMIISLCISCKVEKQKLNDNKKEISKTESILSTDEYKEIKEWKYGFGFCEEKNTHTLKAICYDPNKWNFPHFHKSKNSIENIQDGMIVKAAFLSFDNDIEFCDARRDYSNGLGYVRDYKKNKYKYIKQKLIRNTNYVSEDGRNWEELKILYVREVDGKNLRGDPLVLVYFKCSFFEGEYFINFNP